MADNVVVTAGTGTTIAADEVVDASLGTVKVQYVKLMDGTLDGSSKASVGSNGLSVDVKAAVLPTGASTSAKQDTIIGHVDGIEGLLTTIDTDTGSIATSATTLAGAVSGSEMQVDIVSSALPTGAATSTKQDTGNTSLASIDGKITAVNTGAVVISSSALPSGAATAAKQPALGTAGTPSADVITVQGASSMTALKVDGSGVTQPVSASSLPLPTGAATSSKQDTIIGHVDGIEGLLTTIDGDTGSILTKLTDATQKSQIVDGSGNVIGATSNALDVNIKSGSSSGTQYTEDAAAAADPIGNMLIARRKDTLVTNEVSADGDNIALNSTNKGQLHVKLADTVTVDGSGVTQPVSGSVTANAGTNLNTSALALETTATSIKTAVETIDNAIAGTEMQVDVITLPAIPTGTNVIGSVKLTDGTDTADILDLTNSNPLSVAIVDGTGDQITSFGGGTQYTEGDTDASIIGTAMLMEGATNTLLPVQGTVADGLLVNLGSNNDVTVTGTVTVGSHAVTNAGTFVTQENGALLTAAQLLDDVVATDGSAALTKLYQVGGTDGTNAQILSTNSTGHLNIADGGNTITVDGTVSITANSAVNVAQINGVTPLMGNGVSGTGAQRVTIANDSTGILAGVTTVTTLTGGGIAHDGVDSGNPVKIGGQARTTNPTAVADADRANFITDKLGKQVVVGSIRDLKTTQATTITSSTSENTVLTAVASTFLDVYGVIVCNTSATACDVTFKDSTAGTTRFNIYVPAGETRGFMLPESAAHNQATVNNNWTATCSASVASIKITMFAVKNI